MKQKTGRKLLIFLLTLALVLGLMPGMGLTAYAAPTETLLTTITATGKEQANYSTEGVATVSFSYSSGGSSAYLANWGWWGYGWTATVVHAEGYTITKCVFYDDANRTATDSEAPFVVETTEEDKTPQVNGTPILAYTSKGIKKIEVYGYATPAASYSVTVTAGDHMTKTTDSGAASQTDVTGAITDVVYTANDGYYFPEDYSIAAVNGISVTRNSYTQITVSGTPTADAAITLTAPTAKTKPDAPTAAVAVDCTTTDNNDGKLTGVTTAMEYKKSDATDWIAGTGSDITGLVPGTYYVRLKATDTTTASDSQELTIAEYTIPSYEVTYKVVNGTWSDDTTTDKTESVQSGSTPASVPTGMKAASGYTGGAWDTNPAEATITGATTFTYTFTALPSYQVTYKVVNGTWSDDTTTDKTETIQSGSTPVSVPTGMKAASGYTGGAWDTNPAEATITGATTFTYTFTALPTYEVTYKVVNGTWSDDTTTDKTETVQSGLKPASVPTGMKAASGYTGGAWDTDPTDATITGATTFTYTFTALSTYEVTYKVVNGTWSDDSTADKTETVQSGLAPVSVPTGMKAASGYTGGAWDTNPAEATITGATTFTYTFTARPVVATPTFNHATGTYTEAQNVTISCATEGATIHYTTDGNDPTASSTTYSSAISVGETTTIKAIAVKEGMTDSEVASATYTINIPNDTVATPTFSPDAGEYEESTSVTISCATEGATIYYTTDGNDPTASSTTYNSAISVGETTTIKAIAVKDGMTDSSVASATYTISEKPEPGTVATPTFSPEGGTYSDPQMVSINSETSGATIYYTTDGNDPTTESATFSSEITVTETTTIKAIAVKEGMTDSSVASVTYTISEEPEPGPEPEPSPEPSPEPEPSEDTWVDVRGLSDGDITDDLRGKGYDSVGSIASALQTALSIETEEKKENSELVDAKLMISTDGGETWQKATLENFPEGGIDAILPYPDGTNGNEYSFSVAHMIGAGDRAGEIETPSTTNTASGISVHFNGLSPVMITWTKNSSPSKDESKSEEKAHTHHFVWETVEATEESDGEFRYVCDICGGVQTRVPITAYYVFNKNTTEKIRKAGQGATVKIETSRWISFHKMVMEALAERPDVSLEVSFLDGEYKGNRVSFTIPAGTDTLSLLDENGFSGFLYLAGKFGTAN